MTNWDSWNFLVPQFSFLQCSVWKFSVPEFCFTENTWIPPKVALTPAGLTPPDAFGGLATTENATFWQI